MHLLKSIFFNTKPEIFRAKFGEAFKVIKSSFVSLTLQTGQGSIQNCATHYY